MSYLTDHAAVHVWGNARLDHHLCFSTVRISDNRGFRLAVPEPWGILSLPRRDETYVVYTLGGLTYETIGFPTYANGWINLAEKSSQHGVEVTINVQSGERIPTGECWLQRGKDGSMLLAITRSEIMDYLLGDKTVTWSSYRNPNVDDNKAYYTNSRVARTIEDTLLIYNEWLQAKEIGETNIYINGLLRENPTPADVGLNGSIHYECRTYAISKTTYDLSVLELFNSELDNKRKYLINLPSEDAAQHYRNDVDFKLLDKTTSKTYGIDLYQVTKSDVRMVTHTDVSVSNDWLESFKNAMPEDFEATHLEVTVKDSALGKKAWFDCNLVTELYRLPKELIYGNMIGDTNVIPEWNVKHLEQSLYPRIMESTRAEITEEMVVKGYGYAGVVQASEKSPMVIANGVTNFNPPYYLQTNSSFICYDEDGLQIAVESGQNTSITVSPETVLADGLFGKIGPKVDADWNNQVSAINANRYYRYYKRKKVGGVVSGDWIPAIADDDYYMTNNTLTWYLNLIGWETLVLSNDQWPLLDITLTEGQLWVDIDDVILDQTKVPATVDMFGSRELWQGNRRLIQGIDYHVRGNKLFIQSKEHCNTDADALLEDERYKLLLFGHTDDIGTPFPIGDTGFVTNGTVSQNHHYNAITGVNGLFIVDGKVYDRSQLVIDDHSKVGTVSLPNGKPYQFFSRPATCNGLNWDRNSLLTERDDLLKRIEDYVTSITPPVVYPVEPIARYYYLVSGTLSKMLSDIETRKLNIPAERIEDNDLMTRFIEDYRFEIDNDVCQQDFGKDVQFVEIHPCTLFYFKTLTPTEFDFISRVNRLVLNSKVNVSRYLNVGRD